MHSLFALCRRYDALQTHSLAVLPSGFHHLHIFSVPKGLPDKMEAEDLPLCSCLRLQNSPERSNFSPTKYCPVIHNFSSIKTHTGISISSYKGVPKSGGRRALLVGPTVAIPVAMQRLKDWAPRQKCSKGENANNKRRFTFY